MENNKTPSVHSFRQLLDRTAANYPDVNFMEYKTPEGIEAKTYTQFKKDTDTLSSFLTERGLSGAHAALIGGASYAWAVSFFGTVNCAAVAVPLAPTETDDMNVRLTAFADCTVLFFDKAHRSLCERMKKEIPGMALLVSTDNTSDSADVIDLADILAGGCTTAAREPSGDDLCAIMFTSGTTGFPKGVMLTHDNFIWTGTSVHAAYPTQRMMGCLPFHHAFGLTGNLTKTLVNGRTLCMNDNMRELLADFRLYKPNGMLAVPQIVRFIMTAALKYAAENADRMTEQEAVKEFLGSEMIDICCGAAPLDAETNLRWNETGINVYNGYGMTECAPIVANNVEGHIRHGSVGRPIPCMKVRILEGEIQLKGPNVMQGYYKNPEATAEAFTPDGWLRTGDLGRLDEDGYLFITGRCKNLILIENGENVSAEFIEEKLSAHPLVKECICYGDRGAICAEIVPDAQYAAENGVGDLNKAMPGVLQSVNAGLPLYQHISGYLLRDKPLERTASGKIKRGLAHGQAHRDIVLPVTAAEKKTAFAVGELLGIKDVSMTDNFFALGGNSLNAVELALSLNVKPQTVYDNPYLADLAKATDAQTSGAEDRQADINDLIARTRTDEKAAPYRCALLTGATGFLGVHILKELVASGIKVYCLIRSEKKLSAVLDYYFGQSAPTGFIPVCGNIEESDLGLSPDDLERLTREVDVVFHTAANVHHAGDYSELERTNVKGTQNVIAFCKKANAVLQHTSTVSVHGAATVIQKTEKAVFDENVLDIGQHYTDNVYIHSKYCAEEAVLSARAEGLRANIYRIGNLTWRRSDGKFQINSGDNGFLHRIHAITKLGIYHENMEKYPMDLTPVDECADAYVRLALSGSVNRIYHMFDQNYLDERDMFGLLGVPYRFVSTAEAIELCMANLDDRDIHVYMFYMIISGRSSEVRMINDETVDELAKLGFSWGKPDRAYLTVSPDGGKGHCLDYPAFSAKPMRTGGGTLTPIGKLTLGVLRDAQPKQSRLIRGVGSLAKIKDAMETLGIRKPLFITVPFRMAALDALYASLDEKPVVFTDIAAEPTVSDTDRALAVYMAEGCDGIAAIGGGSVLDTAKVTALRAANPDAYIEDICKLDSDCSVSVPLIMAPTTAGTGSEATLFAVVTEEDKNKKRPFTSDKFQPDVIVLDPATTLTIPPMSTAYTGIDALSHAVESYLSLFAPAFPEDAELAPDVCKRIFEALPAAYREPDNINAREAMQLAAYDAGLAFGRIGTGYIHAIGHRLGEFYHVPHGLAIAAAFTPVLRAYLPFAADKLAQLSILCGFGFEGLSDAQNAERFISAVDKLIADLGIDIRAIAFDEKDCFEIARKSQEEAKLVGYPRAFTDEQISQLVKKLFA